MTPSIRRAVPVLFLATLLFAACSADLDPAPVEPSPPPIDVPAGYELPPGEAVDAGFVALDVTYTAAMQDGLAQQVPDISMKSPPAKIDAAMQAAADELEQSRQELRAYHDAATAGGVADVVLLQGVPGHAVGEGSSAADLQILLTPDEPTAVTTHNVCSNLILSCAERSGSFDACVAAVPSCRHAEPWTVGEDCCPAACKTAYDGQRQRGQVFLEAFMRTFVRDWSCFPGMPSRTGADK